jgi:hypothetical protein
MPNPGGFCSVLAIVESSTGDPQVNFFMDDTESPMECMIARPAPLLPVLLSFSSHEVSTHGCISAIAEKGEKTETKTQLRLHRVA